MSVAFYGDYNTTETVNIPFNTFTSNDPAASSTVTDLVAGDIEIHKDGSTTQRDDDTGVTVSINFDGVTGCHMIHIDLSDNSDAGFYEDGSRYSVRVEGATVDAGTINPWVGSFSIGCTLRPTAAGRTLDVAATGEAGIDLANSNGTLDAAQIGADAITAAKIADDAFVAANFATGALTADAFAADALAAATFATGAFTADAFAADAIVAATLATDSITTDALADGTITAAKIAGDAITSAKIADDAIGPEHIAANTIVAATLAADCITSAKIADDAISSEHLNTGALTADAFAADAIVAATLATDSITTDALADGTITAAKIAGDAITSAKIADDAIGPEHVAANTIVADTFAADCITEAKIADNAIAAEHLAAGAIDNATFASDVKIDTSNVLLSAEIATVTSQTVFTLASGSDVDDTYNECTVVFYDDTNSDFPSVRTVSDYAGATRTLTIDAAPDFTVGTDDSVRIFVTFTGEIEATISAGAIEDIATEISDASFGATLDKKLPAWLSVFKGE